MAKSWDLLEMFRKKKLILSFTNYKMASPPRERGLVFGGQFSDYVRNVLLKS